MAIYLIRHGESEGNVNEFFQGSLDCPLTARGEEQARVLARWLKARQVAPVAVYASPLQRAFRTAALVAAELGAPAPVPTPDIAEYSAGELEGLTVEEAQARFPDYINRPFMLRGDFSDWGGESYQAVQTRLARFMAQVQATHRADEILVAAHGGSLYQLLKLWCSRPTPRHYFTRIGNCCCFKLELRELQGELVGELKWMVPLELME